MGCVTSPPTEEARSIFDDLGYSVTGDGRSFRATRDWKEVRVTALGDSDATLVAPPEQDGEALRCFVAWQEHCGELVNRLAAVFSGDWALIAVDEEGAYQVMHRPE